MPRRTGMLVAGVWLCFLLRGLFYSMLLPVWEGFDEYSHFAYIEHVARESSLPIPGKTRMSRAVAESLGTQPLPWQLRDLQPGVRTYDRYWQRLPPERPALAETEPDYIYEAQQPPLYYWLMAPVLLITPGGGLAVQVLAVRAASILLGSLAVPIGFMLARRVLKSEAAAIASISLVVCMPMGFINFARAGNESLAVVVYTVIAYYCVRIFKDGPTRATSAALGIAMGLGLLTKAYFLTALPAALVIFVFSRRRDLRLLLLTLGVALVMGGWWYARMLSMTGDLTGQIQSVAIRNVSMADKLHTAATLDWFRGLDTMLFSYIWFGGWSFLQVRGWMYHVFYVLFAVSIIGLWRALNRGVLVLLLLHGCLLAAIAFHIVIAQIQHGQPMTCGWYLFCLVFAQATLMCAGLGRWAGVAAILFGLLDIYTSNMILMPYYHGLTVHDAVGKMRAFRLEQIGAVEFWPRVLELRPYLAGQAWPFAAVWILATIALIACAVLCAGQARIRSK